MSTRSRLATVARRHGLEAILLFGSRARGDARPGSDWDLCVSAPGRRVDEIALIGDLADAVQGDVDLCIFERAGPALKGTVAREGSLCTGPASGSNGCACAA
jgi:predicted nucleotidyltransferase